MVFQGSWLEVVLSAGMHIKQEENPLLGSRSHPCFANIPEDILFLFLSYILIFYILNSTLGFSFQLILVDPLCRTGLK